MRSIIISLADISWGVVSRDKSPITLVAHEILQDVSLTVQISPYLTLTDVISLIIVHYNYA